MRAAVIAAGSWLRMRAAVIAAGSCLRMRADAITQLPIVQILKGLVA